MKDRFNCNEDLSRRCSNFKFWIENNHLLYLGFTGPYYTWARGNFIEIKKCARLDQGLCNEQWRLAVEEANCLKEIWKYDTLLYPLLSQVSKALDEWNKCLFGMGIGTLTDTIYTLSFEGKSIELNSFQTNKEFEALSKLERFITFHRGKSQGLNKREDLAFE
ncbi:hypothetical protein Cgig2_033904 [Carnegiea gigantea]|uniref:Uncharacterized protein n=1 Tax=Carnegiea gigantea TaxID=171969 RepID=A0A9Q1GM48_9CARY|nr:hypothetical protein Cgig2_033904 [Carnegiea gigantea]